MKLDDNQYSWVYELIEAECSKFQEEINDQMLFANIYAFYI